MKEFKFSDVELAIQYAVQSQDEAVLLKRSKGSSSEADYLSTFAYFVENQYSPDYPCDEGSEYWLEELNLSGKLAAVWDYDYYQLSLVLSGNDTIIIKKHTPSLVKS